MKHLSKFLISTSLLFFAIPGCGGKKKGNTDIITYHTYKASTQNNEVTDETFINNLKNGINNAEHPFVKVEVTGNDKFDFVNYQSGESFRENNPFTEKTTLSYITSVDFNSSFYINLALNPIDFSMHNPSTRSGFMVAYNEILLPYEFGRNTARNAFVRANYRYFEHKLIFENYPLGSLLIEKEITQSVYGHGYLSFSDGFNLAEMKLYIDGTSKEFTYTFSYYGEGDINLVDGDIDATTFTALFSLFANKPHNKTKLDFSMSGTAYIETGMTYDEEWGTWIVNMGAVDVECKLYYQIDNPDSSHTALSQIVYISQYQDPIASPEEYSGRIIGYARSLFGPNQTVFWSTFPTYITFLNYEITSLRISNGNLVFTEARFYDVEDDDGNVIEKHHKDREFEYELNQFGLVAKSTITYFDVRSLGDSISVTGTFLYK